MSTLFLLDIRSVPVSRTLRPRTTSAVGSALQTVDLYFRVLPGPTQGSGSQWDPTTARPCSPTVSDPQERGGVGVGPPHSSSVHPFHPRQNRLGASHTVHRCSVGRRPTSTTSQNPLLGGPDSLLRTQTHKVTQQGRVPRGTPDTPGEPVLGSDLHTKPRRVQRRFRRGVFGTRRDRP